SYASLARSIAGSACAVMLTVATASAISRPDFGGCIGARNIASSAGGARTRPDLRLSDRFHGGLLVGFHRPPATDGSGIAGRCRARFDRAGRVRGLGRRRRLRRRGWRRRLRGARERRRGEAEEGG